MVVSVNIFLKSIKRLWNTGWRLIKTFFLTFLKKWGIIVLQCCITKQINYMYTYIPSLLAVPPTPPPIPPSRSQHNTELSSLRCTGLFLFCFVYINHAPGFYSPFRGTEELQTRELKVQSHLTQHTEKEAVIVLTWIMSA